MSGEQTEPRLLTDQPWADVVVDLRTDRSTTLPTQTFTGRRKTTGPDGSLVVGSRRNLYATGPDTLLLKWTDPTGFTGAVVATDDEHVSPMTLLVSHVAHLTSAVTATKWKNVTVPRERGEAVFFASLPGLRQILTDGTITAPVPGAVDSLDMLRYRLAWATVGITDLSQVSFVLRDWDRTPAISLAQERDPNQWPEELTLRGPNLVAAWQRAGFDTATTVGEWVERLYPRLDDARSQASQRHAAIEDLATWRAAGFTPEETLDWFPAARYDRNEFASRFVPATTCADLRDRGVTPGHLDHLTRGIDARAAQSVAARHVLTWLNVSPDPTRVCWYAAAGVGKAEAKRMERSAEPPSTEQLQLLAGLRASADALPVTLP